MNKGQFLTTLRSSLGGLPKTQLDEVIADYEEYFRDGLASGRSEEEISKGLGDPAKIAKELLAEMHINAWQSKKSVANLGRVLLALTALGSLNLFLAIPMLVMMSLLTASYAASVGVLLVGVMAGASYLPGFNALVQFDHGDGQTMHIVKEKDGRKVEITQDGKHGMNIHVEGPDGTKDIHTPDDEDEDGDVTGGFHVDLKDLTGLSLSQARGATALGGIGGGALWLLVNLLVTRLLIRGFVKYARLNYSILRGE